MRVATRRLALSGLFSLRIPIADAQGFGEAIARDREIKKEGRQS